MIARRSLIAATMAALALAPAAALAAPGGHGKGPGKGKPSNGARSLGDPLLPQLGNGGYDADHYRIKLDYDPKANRFRSATTKITATASRKLRELSFDFQDLDVASVSVDGRRAAFKQVDAKPRLSSNPEVTQPMKLVVRPQPSSRPKPGRQFTVAVRYSGKPKPFTDPDTSIEGWIAACYPLKPPQTCDGSFVANEPMGAQTWFPSNNYPTDKATFDTLIRVPKGKTALGVGELLSTDRKPHGTVSWHWRETNPTATYLTTATVGDFDYEAGSFSEDSTGRELPVYNAVDASASPAQAAAIGATLAKAPGQVNFLSDLYGPYPFNSTGAIVDRAAGVGYALEVQTKPLYAGGFTSGNPSINVGTQLHELSPTSGSATASRSRAGRTSGSTRAGRTSLSGTGSSAATAAPTRRSCSTTSTPTRPRRTGRPRRRSSTATRRSCSSSSRPTSAARWRSRAIARSSATAPSSTSRAA